MPIIPKFALCAAALALAAALPAQAPAGNGTIVARPNATVKILLLNGQDGQPMKHLWVIASSVRRIPTDYPQGPSWTEIGESMWTDQDGEVTFQAPKGGAVSVSAEGYTAACRPPLPVRGRKFRLPAGFVLYPVSRILAHGIVTENTCGKDRAVPKPGVLVIFARPMTPWERLRTYAAAAMAWALSPIRAAELGRETRPAPHQLR